MTLDAVENEAGQTFADRFVGFSETVGIGTALLVFADFPTLFDASRAEFAFVIFTASVVILAFVLGFRRTSANEVVGIASGPWATHTRRSIVLRLTYGVRSALNVRAHGCNRSITIMNVSHRCGSSSP